MFQEFVLNMLSIYKADFGALNNSTIKVQAPCASAIIRPWESKEGQQKII